jgi:hypothetical protein
VLVVLTISFLAKYVREPRQVAWHAHSHLGGQMLVEAVALSRKYGTKTGFLICPPDEPLSGFLVLTCDCEVYSTEHSLHALQLLNQIAEMGQDLLVRGGRGGLTTLICLASCNSSDSECAPSPAAYNPFLPSSCMQHCVAHMAMCVF